MLCSSAQGRGFEHRLVITIINKSLSINRKKKECVCLVLFFPVPLLFSALKTEPASSWCPVTRTEHFITCETCLLPPEGKDPDALGPQISGNTGLLERDGGRGMVPPLGHNLYLFRGDVGVQF